jgi:stage II sporulation protein D
MSRTRAPLRAGLLSAVLAGALLAAAAPATAVVDTWQVPAQASITVRGHGYGHGHGMSQYGAQGAALQGLTYREIGSFYYPGTAWGTRGGRVGVLLSADTTDDLVVRARSGLAVADTAGGGWTTLPDNGASQWRVAVRSGADRVSYRTDGWHPWRDLRGAGQFGAHGSPVTLVTPSGTRAYRGVLRAAPVPGSTARDTVNVVSLESYLKGVVPLEMPATWSPAAVQAQAVAARTYAAYERAHPRTDRYQICDTTSCQVYGGYDAEHPASNAAVDATRGAVLLAGGEPAFTQFGSSSGGWTSAGSVPYLPAREDPYDGWSGNPNHSWSLTLTDAAFERTWPGVGDLRRIVVTDRDGHGDWGGRVRSLRLVGSKGSVTVSGDGLRSALGLKTPWVTFVVRAAAPRRAAPASAAQVRRAVDVDDRAGGERRLG